MNHATQGLLNLHVSHTNTEVSGLQAHCFVYRISAAEPVGSMGSALAFQINIKPPDDASSSTGKLHPVVLALNNQTSTSAVLKTEHTRVGTVDSLA